METWPNNTERLSLAATVQPILQEDRKLELASRDVALLVMIQYEIQSNADGLLTLPYSTIQSLSSRLDVLDVRDEQKAERRLSESMTRLIKSGCISKADMNRLRLSMDAEYQLTSLGESIADWHSEQSSFSGEPLTAIFRGFISQLSRISEEAETASTSDDWYSEVTLQTQHVLRDMLVSIQRHQKELDRQHANMREFIPTLLTSSSEISIDQCENQLDQVIKTIEDLQEAVLSSSSTAFSLIDRIEALAKPFAPRGLTLVYDDLQRRLQSINQWTTQRAIDWFEHHNVVHNFLRTVIRVDRQRRVTDALKRAIAEEPGWSLEVADEPSFVRMREDILRVSNSRRIPRVAQQSQKREREFAEVEPDELPNLLLDYFLTDLEQNGEAKASAVLSAGRENKSVSTKLVPHFPWLIGVMVGAGRLDTNTRDWVAIAEDIEIEELRVTKK